MNNETWGKIALVLVVIIFGSGALIWTYNKIQGRDLSHSPEFDLSAYDSLEWPTPNEVFDQNDQKEETSEEFNQEQVADQLAAKVEQKLNNTKIELKSNRVYFKYYFKGKTAQETQSLIQNFLQDFPAMQNYQINDFLGQKCYLVKLPVEGREEILSLLELNETIERIQLSTDGAPNYDLCFGLPKYMNEVRVFLLDFPAVELLTKEIEIEDYIAFIDYQTDQQKIKDTLDKLSKDYSDVVTVVE